MGREEEIQFKQSSNSPDTYLASPTHKKTNNQINQQLNQQTFKKKEERMNEPSSSQQIPTLI